VNVLVTGASGFLGKNLCATLRERANVTLEEHDLGVGRSLAEAAADAEVVFHLAGVNRPERSEDFQTGNARLTAELCAALELAGRRAKLVLTSSVQAELDNPYGRSKLSAENEVAGYCARVSAEGVVYRLSNLFGKWCRPNYNSVTATFCHNIARGLPITVSDPTRVVELTYVDDVVAAFTAELGKPVTLLGCGTRTRSGATPSRFETWPHSSSLSVITVGRSYFQTTQAPSCALCTLRTCRIWRRINSRMSCRPKRTNGGALQSS
jgi:nucleoside-diphosphate-sugar epimerase